MRHNKPRVRDLPIGSVAMGPEHFTGMQDKSLSIAPADPRWAEIEGTEEHAGRMVINTTNLPDLMKHPDPRAFRVMQALYRLGAFD